ncbi:MAG: flagellar export chaperone FliS [Calditrichaeota bacterium]|nr:MAG: flagellar export chaperone FliS [Calditrichota bacterium]
MDGNQLNYYKKTQILTAEPAKIILMLYDGAISFMQQAARAAEQKAYIERANKITRTNNILLELLSSLDFEYGGEIAKNLREIYVFLVKELIKADLENNPETIQQCSQVLETIRDAWITIVNNRANNEPNVPEKGRMSFSNLA